MKRSMIFTFLLLAGCGHELMPDGPAADHPASPRAAEAPYQAPRNVLADGALPSSPSRGAEEEDHDHHHHQHQEQR